MLSAAMIKAGLAGFAAFADFFAAGLPALASFVAASGPSASSEAKLRPSAASFSMRRAGCQNVASASGFCAKRRIARAASWCRCPM